MFMGGMSIYISLGISGDKSRGHCQCLLHQDWNQENAKMVFSQVFFNRLNITKIDKTVNSVDPHFEEFCHESPFFYFIFRCPITLEVEQAYYARTSF